MFIMGYKCIYIWAIDLQSSSPSTLLYTSSSSPFWSFFLLLPLHGLPPLILRCPRLRPYPSPHLSHPCPSLPPLFSLLFSSSSSSYISSSFSFSCSSSYFSC